MGVPNRTGGWVLLMIFVCLLGLAQSAPDPIGVFIRCLTRFASGDLEYGKLAYYSGRTNYIGTMDADGVITLSQGDFNAGCERLDFRLDGRYKKI